MMGFGGGPLDELQSVRTRGRTRKNSLVAVLRPLRGDGLFLLSILRESLETLRAKLDFGAGNAPRLEIHVLLSFCCDVGVAAALCAVRTASAEVTNACHTVVC